MASQNLVVAVGYKNNSCKKVTAPQMGEHQMPPALLDPRRPEKTNMSCKAQLLKDSDSAKKMRRRLEQKVRIIIVATIHRMCLSRTAKQLLYRYVKKVKG